MLQFGLDALHTLSGRQVDIGFAQSQNMPALRFEKSVFLSVLHFLIFSAVPVIPIAFDCKPLLRESKVKPVCSNSILCLWMHICLLESLFHFIFKAAYTRNHLHRESGTAFRGTKTELLQCAGNDFLQFSTKFTLDCHTGYSVHPCVQASMRAKTSRQTFSTNLKFVAAMFACALGIVQPAMLEPYSSALTVSRAELFCTTRVTRKSFIAVCAVASFAFTAYLPLAFIAAILSVLILAGHKFLATQLAYMRYWCLALCYLPSTVAIGATELRISFSLARGVIGGFAALLAAKHDRMMVHGKLPFLCHAWGVVPTLAQATLFFSPPLYHKPALQAKSLQEVGGK